jgi:hypothetical protein
MSSRSSELSNGYATVAKADERELIPTAAGNKADRVAVISVKDLYERPSLPLPHPVYDAFHCCIGVRVLIPKRNYHFNSSRTIHGF